MIGQEQVSVSLESRKVGKLLVDLVIEVKKLVADGKLSFDELPQAMAIVLKDLVPAVASANKVMAEASEDASAFSMAVHLMAADLYKALK